jgi:hypothetical protein
MNSSPIIERESPGTSGSPEGRDFGVQIVSNFLRIEGKSEEVRGTSRLNSLSVKEVVGGEGV